METTDIVNEVDQAVLVGLYQKANMDLAALQLLRGSDESPDKLSIIFLYVT